MAQALVKLALLFLLGIVHRSEWRTYPYFFFWLTIFFCLLAFFYTLFFRKNAFFVIGLSLFTMPFWGQGVLSCVLLSVIAGVVVDSALRSRRVGVGRLADPWSGDWSGDIAANSRNLRLFALFVLPFLTVYVLSFARTAFIADNFTVLRAVLAEYGFSQLFSYISVNYLVIHRALAQLSGSIVAVVLAHFVFMELTRAAQYKTRERMWRLFARGAIVGLLVHSVVLVLQITNFHLFFRINLSNFWLLSDRYCGTLSDPNAFGVVAVLILPMLVVYLSHVVKGVTMRAPVHALLLRVLLIAPLLAMPLFSGSRSYLLGLALWMLVLMAQLFNFGTVLPRIKRARWLSVIGGVMLIVGALVSSKVLSSGLLSDSSIWPSSLTRAVDTFDPSHAKELLMGRVMFSRIALRMWEDNTMLGVGLARFFILQDTYAMKLGIDLENWRDNANNYYLGVLAESGALGLLLMLVFICSLWRVMRTGFKVMPVRESLSRGREVRTSDSIQPNLNLDVKVATRMDPQMDDVGIFEAAVIRSSCFSVAIFLLLLFIGPHLYFEEVRYMFFVLVAGILSRSENVSVSAFRGSAPIDTMGFYWVATTILVLLVAVCYGSLVARQYRDQPICFRGFYGAEHIAGGLARWSAKFGSLQVCEDERGIVEVEVRSLHPSLFRKPLEVAFPGCIVVGIDAKEREIGAAKLVEFNDHRWHKLRLDCSAGKQAASRSGQPRCFDLAFELSHTWIPSKTRKGLADERALGLQWRWPPPCLSCL